MAAGGGPTPDPGASEPPRRWAGFRERVHTLVIGAGVSGLAFAGRFLAGRPSGRADDPGKTVAVLEAEAEIGGWCRTVRKAGFVWDYSGHFFHFKHPEVERFLVERMGADERVRTVEKRARILWPGAEGSAPGFVDFPFQKNIHQLPRKAFVDCLVDLYFRDDDGSVPESFGAMLEAKFGRSIAQKFLVPYNEKLYATSLDRLDVDAMGRFFPHADIDQIIRNFRTPDNASYNATFTYPEHGAVQYVHALAREVPDDALHLRERVLSVDLRGKVARTSRREIAFERLVSSAPFDRLLSMTGLPFDRDRYTYNKVLVFNLGFDRKGPEGVHWIYVPQRDLMFYRVGFYDNIFEADRMSLYVEVGLPADAPVDPATVDRSRQRVLADLRRAGLLGEGQRLVAHHHVVLDPAYVHITGESQADVAAKRRLLAHRGVHSIGRYGGWTYCSIEDNIVEAWRLADEMNAADALDERAAVELGRGPRRT